MSSARSAEEAGETSDKELAHAAELLVKHKAIEDTIERARHYGAIAKDALALFPESDAKKALLEVVDFCVARAQ